MKTIFLIVVLFYTHDNVPVTVDGWYPLQVPTLKRCEIGKARIEEYIALTGLPDKYSRVEVSCEIKEIKDF